MHFVPERARQRLKDIEAAIVRERVPLGPLKFHRGEVEQAAAPDLDDSGWEEVGVGHRWRDAEASAWLRGRFTVPAEWAGERVGLWLDLHDCEPLLYLDGAPAQALDYNHPDVLLCESAAGGESHAFAIDAYSRSAGSACELRAADLVRVNRDAYALFYDLSVAVQALDELGETSREYQGLLLGLDAAMNALDYRDGAASDAFYASLPAARDALRAAFFEAFPADSAREPAMICAGHAHIDVAWLWTLANTRKKCGRTFATALRLMDEFPSTCSRSRSRNCTRSRSRTTRRCTRGSRSAWPRGAGSRPAAPGSSPTSTSRRAKA
jgi:alpha-mannosidase